MIERINRSLDRARITVRRKLADLVWEAVENFEKGLPPGAASVESFLSRADRIERWLRGDQGSES